MGHEVLPFDRWQASMNGLVGEVARTDVVAFTSLVDATAIAERRELAERMGPKPSYTAFVVQAISAALREHPAMNRLLLPRWPFRFRPIQLHDVDAVVAVERVQGGKDSVYAGIIRDSDRKSVSEISGELHALSIRDESEDERLNFFMRIVRKLPSFLARFLIDLPTRGPGLWRKHRGGAFALTTVGKYGVDSINAKWPWPLTFTFGEVKKRALVVDGKVEARLSFHLTLAWRRELCNGAPAARFFRTIVRGLEEERAAAVPQAELAAV